MEWKETLLRYSMLIIGVCTMSFGIALSIKCGLGTTCISSIPNVLSITFPNLTVGQYTIIFNFLLVIFQFVLLKKFELKLLAQMVVCFLFGYVIDFILWCLTPLNPSFYLDQWVVCILGCFILALGILIEVKSDITMLPGDGAVYVLADVSNIEFGKIKPFFDGTLVIVAAIISLYYLGYLNGVREGTVVAACIVGPIMKFYQSKFGYKIDLFLENFFK